MSVIAVILSYNGKDRLGQVLVHVKAQTYPVSQIIVVDNGSDDGSQELVTRKFVDVRLIAHVDNRGVGAGHNCGWHVALENDQCEFVWTLEHDCIPEHDCLEQLLKAHAALRAQSPAQKIGALLPAQIAPYLLRDDDKIRYFWRRNHFRKMAYNRDISFNLPSPARSFTFNGTLLPVEVIRHVGFLNTDFFVGYEDREYSWRVQAMGYDIYHVPSARVQHSIFTSLREFRIWTADLMVPGGGSVTRDYYAKRNRLFLEKQHKNKYILAVLTVMRLPVSLLYILLLGKYKWRRVCARCLAIRDGLSGS